MAEFFGTLIVVIIAAFIILAILAAFVALVVVPLVGIGMLAWAFIADHFGKSF